MLKPLPKPDPALLKIGIVGGGLMGHAVAAFFLAAGSEVFVFEAASQLGATLPARMTVVLGEIGRGAGCLARLHVCTSLEGMDAGIHLLIEAIPENLASKQELFGKLESLLPNAILASNSSVFRIGDIASKMLERDRAVGTHWWNPPHLIPVVEVIQGAETAAEAVNWVLELLDRAGKTPVHVRKDTAGFSTPCGERRWHWWKRAWPTRKPWISSRAIPSG